MKFKAVELNYLDEETILKIREWRNQDFVRKNMLQSHTISEDEHLAYIERIKQDENRGLYVFYLDDEPFGVFQYAIKEDEDGKYITNGCYLIHEEDKSLGYGTILFYMINWIEYNYFEIEILKTEVLSMNQEALGLHKRLKVEPDEVKKDAIEFNGKQYDIYCFGGKVYDPGENSRMKKVVEQIIEKDVEIVHSFQKKVNGNTSDSF